MQRYLVKTFYTDLEQTMYKSSYNVESPFVTHVIHPVKEHKKTIIFFHGLGTLTSIFHDVLTSIQSPVDFHTKVILIQATVSGYSVPHLPWKGHSLSDSILVR